MCLKKNIHCLVLFIILLLSYSIKFSKRFYSFKNKMDRPPSYSTRSQHNTRKILNKQLSKENMYSTSPNMRSLKTTTFRT